MAPRVGGCPLLLHRRLRHRDVVIIGRARLILLRPSPLAIRAQRGLSFRRAHPSLISPFL